MAERVLVTGGHGKVGARVVEQLRSRGVGVRIGARAPQAMDEVCFNWSVPATFAPALEGVDAVFLTAPTDRVDQLPAMRPLLERAATGVDGPLVLLSASSMAEGGPMMGQAHAWLRASAPQWAVLRPSWFMQNFVTQHLASIREEGAIYSATGEGRVPFIDAADIAAVATTALLDPVTASGELVLTGPRALGYDEAAALISAASGRSVRHLALSPAAMALRLEKLGLPPDYAALLAGMDADIAQGAEDRVTAAVERVMGRAPNTLEAFLASHRAMFT